METLYVIVRRIAELEAELRSLREKARELGGGYKPGRPLRGKALQGMPPDGVAKRILVLLKGQGVGMERAQIAETLGEDPNRVSAALTRLKDKKLVTRERGRWKLCG